MITDAMKSIGIYIHIPFCVRKCLYCDFLSAPASPSRQERYVRALCREISEESKNYGGYAVNTVFLGGGTPSLLSGERIREIMDTVFRHYRVDKNCEISMEVNPGTVTREKLLCFRDSGVNRLSIGLQSAEDDELKALGRIHTGRDFFRTYEAAAEAGFTNINIDLMSAIPGQTPESLMRTLKKVAGLRPAPTHISVYSLIIEEGTPFYENTPELPDEETEREMYKITCDFLEKRGYRQYEISNFALPGCECRHNQAYWRRGNYVGFGAGAASLVDNVRFCNTRDMESYVNHIEKMKGMEAGDQNKETCVTENDRAWREVRQALSRQEQMEEFMFLGLRMIKGVSRGEFFRAFGVTMESVYPGIVEDFCRKGLLSQRREPETGEEWISLTRFGIDVSNIVMAEFLLT